MNKSEFIRQHPDKKAKEIVALAAGQGVTITPAMVYVVRSHAAKKAAGAPRRKPGRPRRVKPGTCSEFIRQHPDLPPREVLALGAQQGLRFSSHLVHAVRADVRKRLAAQAGDTPVAVVSPPSPQTEGIPGMNIVLDSPDRLDTFRLTLKPEEVPAFQFILSRGTAQVRTLLDDIDAYADRMASGYQVRHG